MSPCPWITPKSPGLEKFERKGASKRYRITTGSRSDPNPRELKSFSPKCIQGSIVFGTQKSQARHCHQINLILAAAHSKSVNIGRHIAELFGRIVIVPQNHCSIFAGFAQ
jgi:hypothetical protein